MLTTLFLTFVLATTPADTERTYHEVSIYDGHVTLEVPSDWEEIPPELLESHSLGMAESTEGRLTEVYQHGFRTEDPEFGFVLPECLVQIRESGRLSYGRFLELPTIEEMHSAGKGGLVDHSGIGGRRMELHDAIFDRDTYSLHLRNKLELSGQRETTVESVAFLTERGLLTIHFYARTTQIEAMAPIYARIIDSVRFDDELRYQPRWTDRLPPRLPLILFSLAVLIAVGATAMHLYQRRRKQP